MTLLLEERVCDMTCVNFHETSELYNFKFLKPRWQVSFDRPNDKFIIFFKDIFY